MSNTCPEHCDDCGKPLKLSETTYDLRGKERRVRCFPCHRAHGMVGDKPQPVVTEDDCF